MANELKDPHQPKSWHVVPIEAVITFMGQVETDAPGPLRSRIWAYTGNQKTFKGFTIGGQLMFKHFSGQLPDGDKRTIHPMFFNKVKVFWDVAKAMVATAITHVNSVEAKRIVLGLLHASQWFEALPMPGGIWELKYKSENSGLVKRLYKSPDNPAEVTASIIGRRAVFNYSAHKDHSDLGEYKAHHKCEVTVGKRANIGLGFDAYEILADDGWKGVANRDELKVKRIEKTHVAVVKHHGCRPLFQVKIGTMSGELATFHKARAFWVNQKVSFATLEALKGRSMRSRPDWQEGVVWQIADNRVYVNRM